MIRLVETTRNGPHKMSRKRQKEGTLFRAPSSLKPASANEIDEFFEIDVAKVMFDVKL